MLLQEFQTTRRSSCHASLHFPWNDYTMTRCMDALAHADNVVLYRKLSCIVVLITRATNSEAKEVS